MEVYAQPVPQVTAPSAFLMDGMSKRVIYSKNSKVKRPPASTTKLLTAIIAVENLPLNRVITIPAFAEHIEPSKINVRAGERYYVKDLIRATLISSANDAAEVLVYAAAGSRGGVGTMMTRKARAIGAMNSRFVRASGLPASNQYSTAQDMAKIMSYAQRFPFIVETLRTKETNIRSLSGRRIYLRNHNKMLWRDSRTVLGKTGWTRNARHCFVGLIQGGGKRVYVAMMGSHSLWRDLKKLVDYQFGSALLKIHHNRKMWPADKARKIQLALRRAGYSPGPADGVFGPKTVRAVQKFQKAHGLRSDGIVGANTWAQLRRYL